MKITEKIFVFLTFGVFGLMYFHLAANMLKIFSDGWYVGHINLYGDLVFHLTLINRYISAENLIIQNPIFAGSKINYPVFADLITAQLATITNIKFALFITTFTVGLFGIFISRAFIKKFINNEKIVFLSLLLFFVNGGLGFYYFFRDLFLSKEPLLQFIQHLPREYTDIKNEGYWWINTYLAYFLPQRTFLFAFPITLIVLRFLYEGSQNGQRRYFLLAAILAGFLPLVQVHSLLLIFLLSFFYAPFSIIKSKNKRTFINWSIFAFVTAFIAILFFRVISSAQNPLLFIKFQPGWTSGEDNIKFWFTNFEIFKFWLKNLGVFGPTLLVSVFWLYKKNRHLFLLYMPFVFIFIISNIFIFQPWHFDNSKLLVYWFFVSCIVVSYFIYNQLFQKSFLKISLAILLVTLMVLSGSIDLWKTFTPATNYKIFSQDDLTLADIAKNQTPKDAIFLTASNHNHPIPALAGRSVFLGFKGWLWTHGIDYGKRESEAKEIYLGGDKAEFLIKQYKIHYVTIGFQEKAEYQVFEEYFQKFKFLQINDNLRLYDVSDLWANNNR